MKVAASDLATTVKLLTALGAAPEAMKAPVFKPLRAVLHTLRQQAASQAGIGAGSSLAGKVSDAISDQRWQDAMDVLSEMRAQKQFPKLGALQRWVRDCDAAANTTTQQRDQVVMRVLDAVLRTADPTTVGALAAFTPVHELKQIPVVHGLKMLGTWDPYPESKRSESCKVIQSGRMVEPSEKEVAHYKPMLKVICEENGEERRPPNHYPMTIYTSIPSIINYNENLQQSRLNAPILPETFVIQNLLSLDECRQILTAAESVGFTPDEPVVDTANNRSILAHNVIWLTDPKLTKIIEDRARPHLPPTMPDDGDTLALNSANPRVLEGINPRWRIYRYVPGAIYRPHIDGGWPKSEYDVETETYTFDASGGTTWSRLTFLIYLNEGFKGGETTYFVPSKDAVGVMDAKSVVPRAGCAMVFPHGSVKGNLLHEGSGVLEGVKYIARTDVLYRKAA
ncbi:hypothetical protein BCR33DRAFT_655362 [Rhizoclosmatium globosum]|uniref:Prolyl 4-hydroxylase alpha subunit domain-containing protein n=1 Tax=Rhizoclosmatium globosum TaxID=329046 RepID=A0A1Y2CZ95_9FUNG|nr:hypothetical protein BCR33DRAFT_655362 [Rhizoclosmatium globosum]|eukprot:ORY52358.1 hypothetical protein BCR33DRAFT_655362 [Rhizoclosmatium globosum]